MVRLRMWKELMAQTGYGAQMVRKEQSQVIAMRLEYVRQ
jgi:hypothetical protein